jgi:HK97 family phage portal protein
MSATTIYSSEISDGRNQRSAENPDVPLSQALWDDELGVIGIGSRKNGIRINRNRVLGYSAVWRAVTFICGKIGAMPTGVYRIDSNGKEVDRKHPAHWLLSRRPNEWMTPAVFKKTLQAHALLRGNGYAYVERDANARPISLLPLDSEVTWPVIRNGDLWYATEVPTLDGQRELRRLPSTDVIHIKGLSWNGLVGLDVMTILRDTFAKAIATRDYSAKYFSNSAQPRTVLEFPMGMPDQVVDRLVNRWSDVSAGLANAHRTGILREGVKLHSYSHKPQESQLTESQDFDAVDVANVFGLPPRKVGLDQKGGYNSIYEENQSILDDTLTDWIVGHEEEYEAKLLTEEEQRNETHEVIFDRKSILQVNPAVRSDYLAKGIANGWLSPNEARLIEDLNRLPDDIGDQYFRPANLVALNAGDAEDDQPDVPSPTEEQPPVGRDDWQKTARAVLRSSLEKQFADVVGRMARRLATHCQRDKSGDLQSHLPVIATALSPVVESIRSLWSAARSVESLADELTSLASRSATSATFEADSVSLLSKLVFQE